MFVDQPTEKDSGFEHVITITNTKAKRHFLPVVRIKKHINLDIYLDIKKNHLDEYENSNSFLLPANLLSLYCCLIFFGKMVKCQQNLSSKRTF